jgi:hypothetical protein
MEGELCKQEIYKMIVDAYFFDIFGTIGFIIILYIGMRFSKYKINHVKWGGYALIAIATIGLVVDLYNVMHKYIIPLIIK